MRVLGERLDMKVGMGVRLYQNQRRAPVVQGPQTFKFFDLDSLWAWASDNCNWVCSHRNQVCILVLQLVPRYHELEAIAF